jgi:hypothetical protein
MKRIILSKLNYNKNKNWLTSTRGENEIDNHFIRRNAILRSECFGVKYVKIYPEMTSQYKKLKIWFWLII